MHNLFIIACISKDRGLGQDGHLLWKIPEDMKFFRETTTSHTVVMGRKTFESIGNKPLPNRKNIVLSHQDVPSAQTYHNQAALDQYLDSVKTPKFIIGGASLYQMYLDQAEKLFLTEVQSSQSADAYFPEFDQSKFLRRVIKAGQQDHISYEIVEYTRKPSHQATPPQKQQESQNRLNQRDYHDLS